MNYDLGGNYGAIEKSTQAGQLAYMPTMKDRLEAAVVRAEKQLETAKKARELFDRNPDLEELINLLQSGGF